MLAALDQSSSAVEQVNHYLYCIEQQKSSNMSIILEYDKESQDLHAVSLAPQKDDPALHAWTFY